VFFVYFEGISCSNSTRCKIPAVSGGNFVLVWSQVLQNGYTRSLRALLALLDFEFDLLALIQVAETLTLDGGVWTKTIRAVFHG